MTGSDVLGSALSMDKVRGKKRLLDDDYLTCETRAEEKKLEKKLAALEKDADKLRDRKAKILEVKRRWGEDDDS